MNGRELADRLAGRMGWSHADGRAALDSLLEEVTAALTRGEKVTLRGFGSLVTKVRAERRVRHPRTGVVSLARSATSVTFRPGRTLLAAVASQRPDDALSVESTD